MRVHAHASTCICNVLGALLCMRAQLCAWACVVMPLCMYSAPTRHVHICIPVCLPLGSLTSISENVWVHTSSSVVGRCRAPLPLPAALDQQPPGHSPMRWHTCAHTCAGPCWRCLVPMVELHLASGGAAQHQEHEAAPPRAAGSAARSGRSTTLLTNKRKD